jgi:hypothetical protein
MGRTRDVRCGRSFLQGSAGQLMAGRASIRRELAAVIVGVGRGARRPAKVMSGGRRERVVAELAQRVVGTAQQLARDRQHGAVGADALFELEVVGVVG